MKKINVSIFCDEIKNEKLDNGAFGETENWDYIGVCIVPTSNIRNLSIELNNFRCGAGNKYTSCSSNCSYHYSNQIKIHYQKYDTTNNFNIANRWCDVILNNITPGRFYMHILGINLNKLDKSYFKNSGEETNVEENIYNRFFRTAIIYPLKKYFSDYDLIEIDGVYHDTGDMKYHKYFKYQPLRYIDLNDDKIVCNCNEITFLETNHLNCLDDKNTMLQFIDLFLGANFNMLHNSSSQKNKVAIAKKLFPITDRFINNPNNINSRYYNIYSLSFFPRKKLTSNASEFEKEIIKKDNFYTNREMKLQMSGQLSLF